MIGIEVKSTKQKFQTLIDRLNTGITAFQATNEILFQTLIDRLNTPKFILLIYIYIFMR